jgi:hypothetical protein
MLEISLWERICHKFEWYSEILLCVFSGPNDLKMTKQK